MKQKTIKVLYWVITILFALFMVFSGISELMQTASAQALLEHLGYPLYLNTILGIAKILAAIALIQTKFKTIKEWAYAGLTIDILGAVLSTIFVRDSINAILFTSLFLVVLFLSYGLWKKVERTVRL